MQIPEALTTIARVARELCEQRAAACLLPAVDRVRKVERLQALADQLGAVNLDVAAFIVDGTDLGTEETDAAMDFLMRPAAITERAFARFDVLEVQASRG